MVRAGGRFQTGSAGCWMCAKPVPGLGLTGVGFFEPVHRCLGAVATGREAEWRWDGGRRSGQGPSVEWP
jgi:hypothetical protein